MHALVVTVVHHPEDARILHRQIRALLDAGHSVTYAAPFRECGVTPWPEVIAVDLPRASGRNRLRALRAARAALSRHNDVDIVVIHDPELLLALPRRRPVTVWDVHEDTAAAVLTKPWIPRPLRRPLAPPARYAERIAERHVRLILAEEGYRQRFDGRHPVVPNTTYVPASPARPPGTDRIVYLGQLSITRGARELVELGRLLRPHGISVEVIGAADPQTRELLRGAQREEVIRWYGFVPNDQALRIAGGALAGICLLHDTPNYRHSLPTKVVEYMAHGLPVITSPNPAAELLVAGQPQGRCGEIVPFNDPAAAAEAVLRLRSDTPLRERYARTGHEIARARFHWPAQARRFVRRLEEWSGAVSATPPTRDIGRRPRATHSPLPAPRPSDDLPTW